MTVLIYDVEYGVKSEKHTMRLKANSRKTRFIRDEDEDLEAFKERIHQTLKEEKDDYAEILRMDVIWEETKEELSQKKTPIQAMESLVVRLCRQQMEMREKWGGDIPLTNPFSEEEWRVLSEIARLNAPADTSDAEETFALLKDAF